MLFFKRHRPHRWNINGDLEEHCWNIWRRRWENTNQWRGKEVIQVRLGADQDWLCLQSQPIIIFLFWTMRWSLVGVLVLVCWRSEGTQWARVHTEAMELIFFDLETPDWHRDTQRREMKNIYRFCQKYFRAATFLSGRPLIVLTGPAMGRFLKGRSSRPWGGLAPTPPRWRSTTFSTRLMTAPGTSLSRISAQFFMIRRLLKLGSIKQKYSVSHYHRQLQPLDQTQNNESTFKKYIQNKEFDTELHYKERETNLTFELYNHILSLWRLI